MASQLRRLVMNCTDAHDIGISDRHGEMVSAYWWERIVKSTTNLVELDICTGYRSYPATFDDERQGCKVMDHFLRHGHYCQLRKLEFRRSKHTGPTVVDSHVLKGFSTAHAKTLRHVSMSDILPPTGSVMNMSDVLLAYKSLLSASMPAIQILKVSLSRLDKHDDEKCYCVGNGYCQWYRFPICNLLARNFDELANYFEMELKDGSWDSGEIVMRGCQA
ncbi:hypothetical protein DOTSEDRAFT_73975 [Dothistroma septosporum NZE10]|uniref:Uncharacterized protein n=1 Tax=Dothistroma septosporum (strain NZE10 / CBS 128990) TaxID=675120 RepID=N1PJP0_DOTSN|nr:hypothetical protein DOTSEDRAFT_73975 [Dothistroma septosporum NZE10]